MCAVSHLSFMSDAYPVYWRQLLNVARHLKEDFSNLSFLSSMFTSNLAPFRHFAAFITVLFTLFSETIFYPTIQIMKAAALTC